MTYTLVPASSLLVRGTCTTVVAELDFVELGKVLLVSSCATEVALAAVVSDGSV